MTIKYYARALLFTLASAIGLSNIILAQAPCPSCQQCNVQAIVKTGSVGPGVPGTNYPPVPVEKFDSSLGTLTGVQMSVTIEVLDRRFNFEHVDSSPCPGSYTYPDYFQLMTVSVMNPADATVIAHVGASETRVEGGVPAMGPYDGCVDFGVCASEPPPPSRCCPGCPGPIGTGRDGGRCAPGVLDPQGSGYHETFADQTFPFTSLCLTNNLGEFIGAAGSYLSVPVSAIALESSGSQGCGGLIKFWTARLRVTVTIFYTYCPDGGPAFCPVCFGDNAVSAPCPCSNVGLPGHGCDNSGSTGGAILHASGTTSPDTAVLTSSGELSSVLSIFLQGDSVLPQPVPFGDGLRCIGGTLTRLYAQNAVAGTATAPRVGDQSITARSASLGDPIASGSTRSYQVYYRDPDPAFCPSPHGNTWNVSSGITIAW